MTRSSPVQDVVTLVQPMMAMNVTPNSVGSNSVRSLFNFPLQCFAKPVSLHKQFETMVKMKCLLVSV